MSSCSSQAATSRTNGGRRFESSDSSARPPRVFTGSRPCSPSSQLPLPLRSDHRYCRHHWFEFGFALKPSCAAGGSQ